MSYDIYGGTLRPGHCEVHPDVAETYPCSLCIEDSYRAEEPQYPEPTLEDLCAPHPYYGDDEDGGRCYCGEKRYPDGRAARTGEGTDG